MHNRGIFHYFVHLPLASVRGILKASVPDKQRSLIPQLRITHTGYFYSSLLLLVEKKADPFINVMKTPHKLLHLN